MLMCAKRREKGSASNDANETPVRSRAKSPGTMSVPSANAPEGLGKRCRAPSMEREKAMSAIAFHDDRDRQFRSYAKSFRMQNFYAKMSSSGNHVGVLHGEQSCRACPAAERAPQSNFGTRGRLLNFFGWGAKVE